jgi:ABC-type dipeptide/oligopeptide/nickel transport system permease component
VILSIAGSFRLLIGELIVVEWLFSWPGLGNFLASTIIPGTLSTNLGATGLFLFPPAVAGVVTVITAFFFISDLIAHLLVRIYDPRTLAQEEADSPGGIG